MTFLFSSKNKSKKESEEAPESRTSNVLAAISGVSVLVLETLQDVARFAPVPYLSDICSVALRILEAAQTFKGNKEGFKKLGAETCDLVYAINATCQGLMRNSKTLSTDLEENLRQLSEAIQKIQNFIDKQLHRSRISRFFTYKSDAEAIQGYRSDLKHYLDIFGLQSDITIRELVTRIAEQQQADRGSNTSSGPNEAPPGTRRGSNFHTTFPGFNSGSFSGNIRVNNVAGDQHNSSNESHSFTSNSYNGRNYAGGRYDIRR